MDTAFATNNMTEEEITSTVPLAGNYRGTARTASDVAESALAAFNLPLAERGQHHERMHAAFLALARLMRYEVSGPYPHDHFD